MPSIAATHGRTFRCLALVTLLLVVWTVRRLEAIVAKPLMAPIVSVASEARTQRVAVESSTISNSIMSNCSGAVDGVTSPEAKFKHCEQTVAKAWEVVRAEASPELLKLLEQQLALHRAVASGQEPRGQKYLVWALSGGLGNRVQSLISVFLAAVLSGRVFLMKDWFTQLPPSGTKLTPTRIPSNRSADYMLEQLEVLFDNTRPNNTELLCSPLPMMALRDFRALYPHYFSDPSWRGEHAKVDLSARHDKHLRRWDRLLCKDLKTDSFFEEKFVYIWTNQYFLPGLVANPAHRGVLMDAFPRNNPFQTLLKLFVLPSLTVAARVEHFLCVSGLRGKSFTALQVRAFREKGMKELARAFERCAVESKHSEAPGHRNNNSFFLASLHPQIRDYFREHRRVGVAKVLAPARAVEIHNVAHDQEALTDILILARASKLFISPGSTFGTFAAALGGVMPVRVHDVVQPGVSPCELVRELEPCFGSWRRYDHLLQRSSENHMSCKLSQLPVSMDTCMDAPRHPSKA